MPGAENSPTRAVKIISHIIKGWMLLGILSFFSLPIFDMSAMLSLKTPEVIGLVALVVVAVFFLSVPVIVPLAIYSLVKNRKQNNKSVTIFALSSLVISAALLWFICNLFQPIHPPGNGERFFQIRCGTLFRALDLYKLDNKRYPTTEEGLESLTINQKGKGQYMDRVPEDPWETPFKYTCINESRFLLQSAGRDKEWFTADDRTCGERLAD